MCVYLVMGWVKREGKHNMNITMYANNGQQKQRWQQGTDYVCDGAIILIGKHHITSLL